ncbi:DUF3592 domain-containing protein [Tumidithrix elongata RA019]|uniref:DUF3592 domain-containing protein n=1 Tax=Tumidithrix elongata BACA0141 TaxID=2716417 RepID=A0AAW9PSP8_9CYAN|nr:DUF3592 domain-containing protein [Tumidithrix elongata RA019]
MNLGWILLLIGIILLAVAVKMLFDTYAFLDKAILTRGRVLELDTRSSTDSDGDLSYSYYPVVEFTNSRGNLVQFTSTLGRNPPGFYQGQEVEVLYNPQNISSARIATFGEIWLGTIIVAIAGAVFGAVGIFLLLKPM